MTGMTVVEQALPVVLKTLGGKLGVEIHIGGYEASTDGRTIQIPALPIDGSPSLRAKAYGYGGHEASHIRNTDMSVFQAFAQQGPLARHILNILEDVRIERALIAEFPGMAPVLSDLVGHLIDDDPAAFAAPVLGEEPEVVLTSWLLISRRHRVLKQSALASLDIQAQRVFEATFPLAFRRQLEALLAGLPYLRSGKEATQDAAQMAQAILDLIQNQSQQPPQPEKQPQAGSQTTDPQTEQASGDSGDGTSGDTSDPSDATSGSGADGASSDQGENPSDVDGSGAQGSEAGQGTDTNSSEKPSPSSEGDGQGDSGSDMESAQNGAGGGSPPKADPGQPGNSSAPSSGSGSSSELSQRDALQRLANKGAGDVSDDLATLATDLGDHLRQSLAADARQCSEPAVSALPWGVRMNFHGHYVDEAIARSVSGPLRQRLRVLLEGEARVRPQARIAGRQLMASRLARTAIGDGRVFRRQEQARTIAAAMHILVDASGSMSGSRIREADTSALAIAEAVDVLPRVNLGVSAFRGGYLVPMLRHGERLSSARSRFNVPNSGGTPLAESLVSVSGVLLNQKEEKKVMIVMTDGMPDGGASTSRALVERLRQNGMVVLGVGIGTDTGPFMQTIFGEDQRVIQDVNELREALFQMAQMALRRH